VWIPHISAFRTPLGEVPIDREAAESLLDAGPFKLLGEDLLCDHSVEIQLPLLQRAAPGTPVVPIYVSHLSTAAREAAASSLVRWLEPGTVLLASSDFTHYGRAFNFQPFPPDECVAERLRDLDEFVIEAAGSLREELFFEALSTTSATVCGRDPIALLLAILRVLDGCDEVFQDLLDYQTSGELTGDFRHSVSYAALGYYRDSSFRLGDEERQLLVGSARRTLRHYQETGERRPLPPESRPAALERHAAAFVTIWKRGALRGCVGRRCMSEALADAVPSLTLAAALEDSRFEPVARSEEGLELEVSVLSPMKRIPDATCFRVNDHGACVDAVGHHGLLLPQVATERNWTGQQFLDALARKAGVSYGVFGESSTRLSVFRAQVLH
jgi:AmmeMemoRadiSam system protein A/AmmeMemoRadiSam system protein B